MNRETALRLIDQLMQSAGPKKLRALLNKYGMNAIPVRKSSIISGLELHGKAFFRDLYTLANGSGFIARADGPTVGPPTYEEYLAQNSNNNSSSGSTWDWKLIADYLLGGAKVIDSSANLYNSINGNSSGNPMLYLLPGSSGNANANPLYVLPNSGSSSSGGNTALWVIIGIVLVSVVGLGLFLVLKKKK
jgi:hypothetical protein